MDVDSERRNSGTNDDEAMEYEETSASAHGLDDDEMMEDDEETGEEAMEAESTDLTLRLPSFLPTISPHSASTNLPDLATPRSGDHLHQPLPEPGGVNTETEMSSFVEAAPVIHTERGNGDALLTGLGHIPPSTLPLEVPPAMSTAAPQRTSTLNATQTTSQTTDGAAKGSSSVFPAFASRHHLDPAGASRQGSKSPRAPRSVHISENGDNDDEENYYEDDDGGETLLDVHSLPPIILHLPSLGARSLFLPLQDDGQQPEIPVWLKDRQAELGEASLADVWVALRSEIAREGLAKGGEMIITEKQMDLKMGEDDVHLQSITLLELLQVHHGCELSTPVQLYISFETNRFIARFSAIQKEVMAQAERQKDTAEAENDGVPDAEQEHNEGSEEEAEVGDEGEGEYEGDAYVEEGADDGHDGEQDDGDVAIARPKEEVPREKRERADEPDALEQHNGHRVADPASEHPHAERAQGLPTGPLPAIHGSRIVLPPSSREKAATVPENANAPQDTSKELEERSDEEEGSDAGGVADESDEEIRETSQETQSHQPIMAYDTTETPFPPPLDEIALLKMNEVRQRESSRDAQDGRSVPSDRDVAKRRVNEAFDVIPADEDGFVASSYYANDPDLISSDGARDHDVVYDGFKGEPVPTVGAAMADVKQAVRDRSPSRDLALDLADDTEYLPQGTPLDDEARRKEVQGNLVTTLPPGNDTPVVPRAAEAPAMQSDARVKGDPEAELAAANRRLDDANAKLVSAKSHEREVKEEALRDQAVQESRGLDIDAVTNDLVDESGYDSDAMLNAKEDEGYYSDGVNDEVVKQIPKDIDRIKSLDLEPTTARGVYDNDYLDGGRDSEELGGLNTSSYYSDNVSGEPLSPLPDKSVAPGLNDAEFDSGVMTGTNDGMIRRDSGSVLLDDVVPRVVNTPDIDSEILAGTDDALIREESGSPSLDDPVSRVVDTLDNESVYSADADELRRESASPMLNDPDEPVLSDNSVSTLEDDSTVPLDGESVVVTNEDSLDVDPITGKSTGLSTLAKRSRLSFDPSVPTGVSDFDSERGDLSSKRARRSLTPSV